MSADGTGIRRLLELLRAAGSPMSAEEIGRSLGIAEKRQVQHLLDRAQRAGSIAVCIDRDATGNRTQKYAEKPLDSEHQEKSDQATSSSVIGQPTQKSHESKSKSRKRRKKEPIPQMGEPTDDQAEDNFESTGKGPDRDLLSIWAARYDLLDPETELDLVRKAKKGDARAKNTLVKHFAKVAVSLAKMEKTRDWQDLAMEALITMLKAIDKFDPERNNRFATYATPLMRWTIKRCVRTFNHQIRIPEKKLRQAAKISGLINRRRWARKSLVINRWPRRAM
jgi:DNA-directed RNA polymerase sigma subunit (sigma70/sigma32)